MTGMTENLTYITKEGESNKCLNALSGLQQPMTITPV